MSPDESSTRAGGHAGRTAAEDVLREARFAASRGLPILPIGRQMSCPAKKLTPAEGTAAALEQIENGEVAGLAVRLGELSARTVDGRTRILMALDLEGGPLSNPSFVADWKEAVERSKTVPLLERLRGGWAEQTPTGGERLFFEMDVADVAEWNRILSEIPESDLTVRRDTVCLAEILIRGYTVIAPSTGGTHSSGNPWVRTHGSFEQAALFTGRELSALATVLADLTDAPPVSIAGPLDLRTELVRSVYNRHCGTDEGTAALCAAEGFVAQPHAPGDKIVMNRGPATLEIGGPTRPAGSLWTYDSAADPLTPKKLLTAFDVRLLLEKTEQGHRKDPADLAEEILTAREVSLPASALVPSNRVQVHLNSMTSATVVTKILTTMQGAQHPSIKGVPFLIAEVAIDGSHLAFASLEKNGAVRRWAPVEQESLLLAMAQPVVEQKNGSLTMKHEFPKAVQAMTMQAARASEGIARASQVSDTPVLLRSGKIITEPGYHRAASVLISMPRRQQKHWRDGYIIPARISALHAQQAVDLLLTEWISDFPYATAGDKARALSYMLTMASRQLYGNAAAFLFDAADRGTGKTLLAQLGRIVITGRPDAQTIGYEVRDDVEIEKKFVSATLAGMKYLHIDELPRGKVVTSKMLTEMLTSSGAMICRILGGNIMVKVSPMTLTVCGNNASLGGDLQRRAVPIRLSWSQGGLPQDRTGFAKGDIAAWTRENRPMLLAALHTVLGYGLRNQVGETVLPRGFGSFEGWRDVVLGAMYHVTIDGQRASDLVADGRAEWAQQNDDESDEFADLMVDWVEHFGSERFIRASDASAYYGPGGLNRPELPVDLAPVLGASEKGTSMRWGKQLAKRRDTAVPVDGVIYRFRMRKDDKRGASYRVEVEGEHRKAAAHVASVTPIRSFPVVLDPAYVQDPATGETVLAF